MSTVLDWTVRAILKPKSIVQKGNRRTTAKLAHARSRLVDVVAANPGITAVEIAAELGAVIFTVRKWIAIAVAKGQITVERDPATDGRVCLYYVNQL